MVFKLRTSKETMRIFDEIGASLRLQPFVLSKIAIALSIRQDTQLEQADFTSNTEGLELNRQTITGEYDELFKALIINHTRKHLSDEEYFPLYMKAHLDRGAKLLYAEYKYSGSKFYTHLINLDNSI
jgi:DNA sulfur modification protein DndE